MTNIHNRKLKFIRLTVEGTRFECQVQTWNLENNTDDGERFYAFCGEDDEGNFDENAGEFREEAEDNWALSVTFYSDWKSEGISDFLMAHDQETVEFELDHHPNIPGEHVRWSGQLKVKAPNVGGDARTTEMTEVTMQIVGKPNYERVA